MARSYTIPTLRDDNGRVVALALCRAWRMDTNAELTAQRTDASGQATFADFPDAVDCSIMCTWGGGKHSKSFFNEAPPALTEVSGTLDNIIDGTSHVKIKIEDTTSNRIDFDKITDGVTHKKLLAAERTKLTGVEALADVTSTHTAASITSQGALATKNTVSATEIDALAVTEAKINTGAVTVNKIGALAVTEAKIGSLAVTEGKIGALAVTDAKISDCAIGKLTTGNLTATGTITTGKLQTAASPSARIEITAALIAGYSDATTKQFYLQASDGKAYAGGGNVVITSTGVEFKSGTVCKFTNAGSNPAYIYVDATTPDVRIKPDTGYRVYAEGNFCILSGAYFGPATAGNYVYWATSWGGTAADSYFCPADNGRGYLGSATKYFKDIHSDLFTEHTPRAFDKALEKLKAVKITDGEYEKSSFPERVYCPIPTTEIEREKALMRQHGKEQSQECLDRAKDASPSEAQRLLKKADDIIAEAEERANNTEGHEGLELGGMISLTLCALRELTDRVEAVEAKIV